MKFNCFVPIIAADIRVIAGKSYEKCKLIFKSHMKNAESMLYFLSVKDRRHKKICTEMSLMI